MEYATYMIPYRRNICDKDNQFLSQTQIKTGNISKFGGKESICKCKLIPFSKDIHDRYGRSRSSAATAGRYSFKSSRSSFSAFCIL